MLSSAIAKAKLFTAGALSNRELLATTGSPMAVFSGVFCIFDHSGVVLEWALRAKAQMAGLLWGAS